MLNSRHAEVISKLLQTIEAIPEIKSVGCSFEDSIGRESLHCKFHITFEIFAKNPKQKEA